MCAVKFAYIGSDCTELKTYHIEEKSYNPDGEVIDMTQDIFAKVPAIKEIATVCTLNNKSSIVYEHNTFAK